MIVINFLLSYFADHWAPFLTWALVILLLATIRIYQVKWKKERQLILANRQTNISVRTQISKDNLRLLKEQCDLLNDLLESADQKLDINNPNVDKEVLELIYKMAASQSKGGVSNVE